MHNRLKISGLYNDKGPICNVEIRQLGRHAIKSGLPISFDDLDIDARSRRGFIRTAQRMGGAHVRCTDCDARYHPRPLVPLAKDQALLPCRHGIILYVWRRELNVIIWPHANAMSSKMKQIIPRILEQ